MKIDVNLIEECGGCSRLNCELRIEHGTPEYVNKYSFKKQICPIPRNCPLSDAADFPKLLG
jgi:hypothetical protein